MLNTHFQATTDRTTNRFDTLAMTRNTWQQTSFSPSSIAIHNNGDMARADAIKDRRLSLGLSLSFEPAGDEAHL